MTISKYTNSDADKDLLPPRLIVEEVLHQLYPISIKSVIDFGCGSGRWLRAFKENGVQIVKGLDGKWVDTEVLFENILPEEFEVVDFEHHDCNDYANQYDLVLCVEVAEHVSKSQADNLVESLVRSGKIILFSAAVPHQGGQNHVNEQWPDYWSEKFEHFGFSSFDSIRFKIWDDQRINGWYKQNLHFYIDEIDNSLSALRDKLIQMTPEHNHKIKRLIHPDMFLKIK